MIHKVKIFSVFVLLLTALVSCSKKENQVFFEGGKNPVFSSTNTTGTIAISKANATQHAVTFKWTNPAYMMNTGVSSQSVNYAIQMKEKTSADYITVDVVAADLQKSYTQEDLNLILFRDKAEAGLQIPEDAVREVEVRVVAFLGESFYEGNATNLTSNSMSFIMDKVYSVYPPLWITGEAVASGWINNPADDQKFTYDPNTKNHILTIELGGGKGFKLLTVNGQWQPQWGIAAGSSTPALGTVINIVDNPGGGSDPDPITAPATTGTYTITVNIGNKTTVITQ